MKKTFFSGLLLISLATLSHAASETQLYAIKHLGELNGIALHCKALPETQRMKRALVKNLPKRRELGELFDTESNTSFLKFIQDGSTCPSPAKFSAQVSQGIDKLEQAFTQ